MGDGGPGGHTAPGHALPQGGVAQRRGHRGHWTRTDRVLHVQGHQTLPGKDVIVEAIEDVNLEHKQYKLYGLVIENLHHVESIVVVKFSPNSLPK